MEASPESRSGLRISHCWGLQQVHCLLPPAQNYLEGLIANEDIAIQGEAKFSSLEEGGICFWMLAVCMQWQEFYTANNAEAS